MDTQRQDELAYEQTGDLYSHLQSQSIELAKLREALKDAMDMLERLEWFYGDGGDRAWCLCCYDYRERTGHASDCELAALIKEAKGEL